MRINDYGLDGIMHILNLIYSHNEQYTSYIKYMSFPCQFCT